MSWITGGAKYAFGQLEIHPLTDSCFIYTTYNTYNDIQFPANGMIVLSTKGAILFDTPWDTVQNQPIIDSVKTRFNTSIIAVISTHWHADRTAGLDFFNKKGIPTYSTFATQNLCRENNAPVSYYGFVGDTIFQFGNTKIEAFYPGAGHTSDNIVLYIPQSNILFGGCFVKSVEASDLGNLSDANIGMWPVAIRTLIAHFPEVAYVVPGHQKGSKGTKALKHTRKLADKKLSGRKKEKSRLKHAS
jgi:glyoxylase-like metal-dependent hydrolase (beta-lactamase superfamily II)